MLLQSSKCTFFETTETFISRELLACAEEVKESLGNMRPQLWPVASSVAVVATANNNNVLAVPVVSVMSAMVATSFNDFHSTSVSVRTALFDNDSLWPMSTTSGGAACGIEVKIQVSSLGHKSHAGCEECSFEHYFYFIRLNKISFIYSYFTTVHR